MEQTYRTPFWARALDDLPGLIMPSAARRTADVELSLTYTGKESSEIIALALQRGWCLFKVEKETATSSLSTKLGQIVPSRLSGPSIDRLTPTDTASANPASQSRFFGLGEFPFHTDAAYKERPPRFVLLRCETAGSSGRQTFLLRPDLRPNPAWQRELINALVCVDNGTTRFYSSVLTRHADASYLRYDPVCTRPVNKTAKRLFENLPRRLLATETAYAVTWDDDLCLFIDNWMVLHARGRSNVEDKDRTLERVLLNQESSL